MNGAWLAATTIPPDLPWISPYVENTLRVQTRIRGLVEAAAAGPRVRGTDEQRIGDLYRSYLDESRVEAVGLAPLASELARVDAMRSLTDLAAELGRLARLHADADTSSRLPEVQPVGVAVLPNADDPTRTGLTLEPAGLGMPGRGYYLDLGDAAERVRVLYFRHVAATLALSGAADANAAAGRVLALETALARAELPPAALHDPAATASHAQASSLDRLYPGLPWQVFLDAAGLGNVSDLVVAEPAYLRAVVDLATRQPVATWRDYLRWQLLRRYSPYLSRAYRNEAFLFYDGVLLGASASRPRTELGGLLVDSTFGEVLGRLYVRRYLDSHAKSQVSAMAEQVRSAFAARLRAADWLEPATRRAALDKLTRLKVLVAYPDRWEDYGDVAIRADDLIGNLERLSERAYRRRIARLGALVDRDRWLDTPQATSGYYERSTNTLAIPAGLLQPPWYDPNASAAANWGGVGTVIGHEMGHAFDDQGAHYDGEGRLRDWWTPADHARFEARTAALARQYDHYEPLPGVRVNGALTLSEDVGDLTGVTLAHAALSQSAPAAGEAAIARDRAFFSSFCLHWRALYREPLLRRILASDGHPPQRYRCDGPLSNFAAFYSAYTLHPGDGMFRPEGERVTIW